jgi:hypothetical protein
MRMHQETTSNFFTQEMTLNVSAEQVKKEAEIRIQVEPTTALVDRK